MKTVALHNLGCKVNEYEIEIMQQNVQKGGWKIVDFAQKADIYVINTCSVTNIADRKSRQMIHRARKMNSDAVIVATGCYAQTDTEGAMADDAIDIVIGNNRKTELVDIIKEYMSQKEKVCVVDDLSVPSVYENCTLEGYDDRRIRVDIKIQDGCNQFCSYCIIPYARGRVRSRLPEEIIEEIKILEKKGVKEVVLTGIHLSSYGLDFHDDGTGKIPSYNSLADRGEFTNRDLLQVLDRVSQLDGIKRIRFGSLEPRAITEEFLEHISSNEKICPHFHLSLQSGCDETLKRMNRHYSTGEFRSRVELIRKYYKHPAITTDIIVGFPGETAEEFEKTCGFVDEIGFYETHIFKYSKRKGTVAAGLPGQLTEAQKAERSDVLLEKNERNSRAFVGELIDCEIEILTEETIEFDNKLYTIGHTKDYVAAAVEGAHEINRIMTGKAVRFLKDNMLLLK